MTRRFSKRANPDSSNLRGLAAELHSAQFDLKKFEENLHRAIDDVARAQRLDPKQAQLAHDYGTSLASGNGRVPAHLNESAIRAVQQKFRELCASMHAVGLPGQHKSWFKR